MSVIMLCTALSACGGEEQEKYITLRVATILGNTDENAVYSELLRSYTAQNKTVYVKDTTTDRANGFKLGLSLESTYTQSSPPDVIYYYSGDIDGDLLSHFVSVDIIRKDYPDFASGIPTAVFDSVRASDGNAYCIPVLGEWNAVVINTGILSSSDVQIPDNWNAMTEAVVKLNAAGIIPFANSPDSSAPFIEQLVAAIDRESAVSGGIARDNHALSTVWVQAFSYYSQLCAMGAFPSAALSADVAAYISPSDVFDARLGDRDASAQTDSFELFNSGRAAMIAVDSSDISKITVLNGCKVINFPNPERGSISSSSMMGGFYEGFFISKTAYSDPSRRSAVIEFIESMTDAGAGEKYSALGYIPADSRAKPAGNELFSSAAELAREADLFVRSQRTVAASSVWNEISRCTAYISLSLITPQQASAILSDPLVKLETLIPAQPVSPTDIAPPPSMT